NKMERKNLVERQKHPHNNRNTIVKLLPDGRKLSEEQEEAFNRRVVSFFETLGEDRAALFVELQGEMVDFMMKNQTGEKKNE
ncbi:MAG: MarR family winged helix-turn-helix transcriptional regulator, partial [Candidatus Ornithomonoglobus sp.]